MSVSKHSIVIQELRVTNLNLIKENQELQLAKDAAELLNLKAKLFYEFSPIGHYSIDCNGTILHANNSGAKLLKKNSDDLISLSFSQFINEKHLTDFNTFLLKAKEVNPENFCDVELTVNKNNNIFVKLNGVFLEKEQHYVITAIYRTKKEQIKKKIEENSFFFKETQRIGHIGSYRYGISTNFLETSEELLVIFGIELMRDLTIKTWLDVVHPQDRQIMLEYVNECIKNHITFRKEYRIIRKNDGQIAWVDGWGEIIFDDETNQYILIGVIQDITQRKLSQEKIQNAETRSHRIFESSKEGILILDAITGQITDANPFLIELIGFNYEELVGKELWEIGVFKNIAASKEAFIELQNKEYIRFEDMPLETKAGKSIAVEFVSNVYMVESDKVILCHIRDISDRKKVDEALQESSQLYFAMFEKNQAPQLLIDPLNGKIIDANSAAAGFYGYSLKEFKSMNLSDISTFPSGQILDEMKKLTLAGQSYFQFIHKLASGETCDVEIYTSPLLISGQSLLISTINNITKRKLEEERLVQLNHQLNEVNVLKSQFISTVSHEFRTPLAGILSSVQLLKIYNDTWDKEKKEKMFKQIFDAVQHTKALLDDVSLIDKEQTSKSFFRPTSIQLLPLINEIIEENLNISGTNHKVILKSNLDNKIYHMDAIMIRHIFNNIISNAIKYSSETKKITIDMDETNNKEIKFVVKDKGIGVPNEEIKYLLEPFYRASNIGTVKGTGFGLSIVKRFIDLHNGNILIESTLGKGSKITIILPYLNQENTKSDFINKMELNLATLNQL
ncbi:PAS domain S-box-containing protein [Flavobacterium segetis]|uniref:histidine kinase n=1 Tax=Flavobacterium segetis TaxID=271157 RepID=A0A1M5IQI2_9FLAO|nr:PAS domain-containing sensor histidine kinase [Flavobacterium segetis]SHG30578.1 PAS domain S-box-containing protein [Flavobacterium segetis]